MRKAHVGHDTQDQDGGKHRTDAIGPPSTRTTLSSFADKLSRPGLRSPSAVHGEFVADQVPDRRPSIPLREGGNVKKNSFASAVGRNETDSSIIK
jgi:hypothetical protein